MQRISGVFAVGPVLRGPQRPVDDLWRVATVQDIVTTVAITAVRAQGTAGGTARGGDA